ncbi:MAG: hypothetical protein E6Q97_10980 [Desulfurellales bacterium]|nr:MAG: hypothetical protein E6Q97_10980 [Desulfurellales bacterium]
MSNFKVVCIVPSWYKVRPTNLYYKVRKWITDKDQPTYGPRKGEIVTVVGLNDTGYYMIEGYLENGGYNPKDFRPLDSLTEQIERIEEEGAPVELEPEYA